MRTMSKGGVLVKNPVSAPGPPPLSKILDPRLEWQAVPTCHRPAVGALVLGADPCL